MTIRFIYVAGPMRKGDWTTNVRAGLGAGSVLMQAGYAPFLPQLSWFHDMVEPQAFEDWLAYDFAWIERCDALLRLPGESEGADREVEHAREHDKLIFFGESAFALTLWLSAVGPRCSLIDHEKDPASALVAYRHPCGTDMVDDRYTRYLAEEDCTGHPFCPECVVRTKTTRDWLWSKPVEGHQHQITAHPEAGVAFFFKQWGGRTPKAGGRELDGRTWDEMPA